MPLLPNQALMIESVKRSMEQDQPLFIDPGVLQAAGINPQEYYIQDKDKKTIINPDKLSDYKAIVTQHVEKICTLQRKKLLNPATLTALLDAGKTKDDLAVYLITGLSYPAQAQQAANYGLIRPIAMNVSPVVVPPTPEQEEPAKTTDPDKKNKEDKEDKEDRGSIEFQGEVTQDMTDYTILVEVVINKLE